MKPRYADAIDPVLLHTFALLERIDSGGTISPAEEKRVFEGLIQQADEKLGQDSGEWKLAKYALVSWIDEMLIDAHIWEGQAWWRENVLEWSMFHLRRCNDLYYINAQTALNDGAETAIEMSYLCVMLGFRGLYRDPRLSRGLIDRHGLPKDLSTWCDEFSSAVRQARQRWNDAAAGQASERQIRVALPLWSRSMIVWPWLFAIVLAGLNILYQYYA